jgi:hypothetical protein
MQTNKPSMKLMASVLFIDVVTETLSGLLTWLVIGMITFLLDLYRRFKKLRRDVDDLDRYLTGDSNDPDAPGLLDKVDKVDTEICGLRSDMQDQHRQTDRKLQQLLNNNSNE